MILNRLKLKNFKRYTRKEFFFDEGLIGIIGKNGAGKSTIFDAILFALYGEFKTKGYKEIIRNSDATTKDVVLVELEFEFENNIFIVKRELRGKALTPKAEIYKNEELIVTSVKEVNIFIINLLKMNKTGFLNTLFATQKELTSLSNLKTEERKKLIRKLLGFEKIDNIEIEIKELIKNLKKEIEIYNNEILLSDDEISTKKEKLNKLILEKKSLQKKLADEENSFEEYKLKEIEFKNGLEFFDKKSKEKLNHLNKLKLLENNINNIDNNLKNLLIQKEELLKKQNEYNQKKYLKEEYTSLKKEIQTKEKQKILYLEKQTIQTTQDMLRKQYLEIKEKIKILKSEIDNNSNIENELKLLDKEIKSLEKEQKLLQDKIAGETKLIKDTESKIKNIEKLGKNSACPVCTRPLLDEYEKVLNSLFDMIDNYYQKNIIAYQTDLYKIENNLTNKKQLFKSLDNQFAILNSKKSDLNNLINEFKNIEEAGKQNNKKLKSLQVEYDEQAHQSLKNKFESIEKEYNYLLQLEVQITRIKDIELDINNLNTTKFKLKEEYNILQNQKIEYDEKTHLKIKQDYEKFSLQKDEQLKIITEIKHTLQSIEYEIKILEDELAKNNEILEKVKDIQSNILDYEKLKLHLYTFKNKLNSKISPRISQIASSLFTQITKGRYQHIEIDDEFNFYIFDDNKKYPIERFSGGEIDLANLVLRIAISKTLMELNGLSSISFLAFDEVFGSQDENRRIEILEAFHTIKEQYKQIFLISHEIEIKEMFEKVIEI